MTAKATIDDLFEKDERLDPALLARLERWEGRWRVALGLALAGLLFAPHFINSLVSYSSLQRSPPMPFTG